ncbi:MAG: aldo/keto reductase [Marinoscillum sp.]
MNYRKLPHTALEISEISFGCMSLDLAQKNNVQLLRDAHELGINYFDTADLYDKGANEELVGEALKPIRQEVIIATKVGNEWLPDGGNWRWNPTKSYILRAVEKSLKRLQSDYIDLYQLHGGTIEDSREEVIEAFELLKEAGKIRHYGISSIRPNVIRPYTEESNIVSNMMQYSLLDRRPEENVLGNLEGKVGVMVRGALAKGLLAGKPAKEYLDRDIGEVEQMQLALNKLVQPNRTSGQIATLYVLDHPAVTTAVVGIRTMKQLLEAIGTQNADPLTTQEKNTLSAALKPNIYTAHR